MYQIWNLKKHGSKTALKENARAEVSYIQLYDNTAFLSEKMQSRSLVFLLCTNTIGSVTGYIACMNYGIVPFLLNANIEEDLLKNLVEQYQPQYLWVPKSRRLTYFDYCEKYQEYGYQLLERKSAIQVPVYENLALLLTTSGSTGSPKFVRQSYDNILSNTRSIIEYLEIDSRERPITTLPMNYTYGLSILNTHLYAGAQILLTDCSLMQKEFWDFCADCRATSIAGVPYTYEMLDRLKFFDKDLPYLRTLTQAGGKLDRELHKKFAEYAQNYGKKFVVMYGQTEATARMAYLPHDRSLEKYGSMGIAIPGGRLWLRDTDGSKICEAGKVGELIYEGENVTLGYAECIEDLAKKNERNGILETGDMARLDEDGYFYIAGRKKRFLKVYGSRVSLDELDQMIRRQFQSMDCASTGTDDHVVTYITDEKSADAVKQFISGKTKLNASAFQIRYIPQIPRNDAGKIQYKDLK